MELITFGQGNVHTRQRAIINPFCVSRLRSWRFPSGHASWRRGAVDDGLTSLPTGNGQGVLVCSFRFDFKVLNIKLLVYAQS